MQTIPTCRGEELCLHQSLTGAQSLLAVAPAMADRGCSVPHWIKDGSVSTEALKAEVTSCTKKLCSSSSLQDQRDGSDGLFQLIILVWAQETRHARDAADLVCEEIR